MTKSSIDYTKLINELVKLKPTDHQSAAKLKKNLAGDLKLPLPTNTVLIEAIKRHGDSARLGWLVEVLKKRGIRTMSGVAPIAILTKPYPCPGNCAYCPNQAGVPRSYLKNEPAVMRARHCDFDPSRQVNYRLQALIANGHQPTKMEVIVIGATWSAYPAKYQYWYMASLYRAANEFSGRQATKKIQKNTNLENLKKILAREQKKNETAKYQIIGLTVETRPDRITETELKRLREFGVTRVEIGVQAVDDQILKLNHRQGTVQDVKDATKLLRDFGFKFTYHFMPALPGSNPKKDYAMYDELFTPERQAPVFNLTAGQEERPAAAIKKILAAPAGDSPFNPDQVKFYPTVVTKGSLLYRWWQQGKYQPYSDQQLLDLIIKCKLRTPAYTRIVRLIRDIPGESIEAGNRVTNLRQILQNKGAKCRCIRCREAGDLKPQGKLKLKIIKYRAGQGNEYFISFEDKTDRLFGFLRLRLPDNNRLKSFGSNAFVRELHVYGQLVPKGGSPKTQHRGLGTRLLSFAEQLAKTAGYENLTVISGVGVRGYYRRFGYQLKQTYLTKSL